LEVERGKDEAFEANWLVLVFWLTTTLAQEQHLHVPIGDDPGILNPHDYTSQYVALSMVYETLVRYVENGEIVPALAESWTVSDDGLVWTFKLRQGVTFHDGTPFDATAAKWNLERWVGVPDHDWLPTTMNVLNIETPDDYTVVLTLKEFYYATLYDLAINRPMRFLSPNAVDADGNLTEPIGTGPWQVEERVPEQRVTFKRFENYWGEKPLLERVTFDIVQDPQTRVAALLSGQLDVAGGEYLGALPLESLPALEQMPNITILTGEGSTSYMLQLNSTKPPFDNVNVRRALNHAIDRTAISESVFYGLAQPSTSIFPSNIPYVKPTNSDLYSYNPDLAKELLAEAGWTPGSDGILTKGDQTMRFELVVDQGVFPQVKTLAQVIQGQLKPLGIEISIQALEYDAWLDRLTRGEYDLATQITWGAPYDPHSSLVALFKTNGSTTQASSERFFGSPELDVMIDEVLKERDETERQAKFEAIWAYLDDVAAGVPLVSSSRIYAVRNTVDGFKISPTEYDLDLTGVSIKSQ
jgi:nickel ABC transporter nickel/metallophore binding protein